MLTFFVTGKWPLRPEHYQDINKAMLQKFDTKNEISGMDFNICKRKCIKIL